jgi:long-chain acyl-CoA synthetase
VRIAADGEILVRGANLMTGYWNEPAATAAAIRDGWLHTGDVGELDADGYIRITDRKKDFIKNSGGDMIAPARIEGLLALQPELAQAMVHGDRRPYLVALIVPRDETIEAAAKASGGKPDSPRSPATRRCAPRSRRRSNASTASCRCRSGSANSSSPARRSRSPTR